MTLDQQAQQIEEACRQLQRTTTQPWATPDDRQTALQQLKTCVEVADQSLRLPAIGESGSRGKLILWHELGRGTIREYEGTTRQN